MGTSQRYRIILPRRETKLWNPRLKFGDELVFYQQVQAHAFVLHRLRMLQLEPNAILRVLPALRGEFSSASAPCKPKLEVTTHSKREGTGIYELFIAGYA